MEDQETLNVAIHLEGGTVTLVLNDIVYAMDAQEAARLGGNLLMAAGGADVLEKASKAEPKTEEKKGGEG